MLKILYISPENTVGTLNIWKSYHRSRGNECRYVTFYRSAAGYPEDICLDLPLINTGTAYRNFRHFLQKHSYRRDPRSPLAGNPPRWEVSGLLEKLWFSFRDRLWSFKVEKAVRELDLLSYDIVHFEWGLDFYRNINFAKRVKSAGKKIIITYHGQDMRNRGVISELDDMADLRLSSELDLLYIHPKLEYLFLPFETHRFKPALRPTSSPLKVCHATTDRYFKGSEHIISVCEKLQDEGLLNFTLIEGRSHDEALSIKSEADINIDQLTDLGGWGYGMNSVESLAMGVCTLAFLNPEYEKFIPDHPFVNTSPDTLENILRDLAADPLKVSAHGQAGRDWVVRTHDISAAGRKLYDYYSRIGVPV